LAALSLLILGRMRGITAPHHKARRQAEADLFAFLEEQSTGTKDIRELTRHVESLQTVGASPERLDAAIQNDPNSTLQI
jgi:hypothetical protein